MDIERNLEDQNRINVLCYQFGATSEEFYDKVVTLLNKAVTHVYLSTKQKDELREKGRSALPQKDWKIDWYRCKYYIKNPMVDWPECQIFYKCHVAILIADMNTVNVEKIGEDLAKLKKTMNTDQIVPYRIFIINANQDHMKYFSEEKNINVLPPVIREEDLIEILQEDMGSVIATVAFHFFSEIYKVKQENHTVPLFNAKEEIIKDTSKIKKRKQGRSLKLCGDMALMLGCYKDASAYYLQSDEILKAIDDHLWVGKLREGQAACVSCEYGFLNKEDQQNIRVLAKVIQAITEKMESASVYFRRAKLAKSSDFDKECFFKLLKVLKNLGAKHNFSDFVKFYIDSYGKGAGNLEEHYKMMLKLASFFYEMKMYRKAGLFLKMVADQIIQDNFNQDLARDIYLACFPLYNIPLSKEILPDNFPKNEFLRVIMENPDLGKKIQRVAPVLQLQLVNDVLSISSSDLALQTKIISIILHYFREDINTLTQQQLFSHLISLGNKLNKSLKLDLTFLPQVVKIAPVVEIIKVNVKQHEPGSEKAGSNIFIYNPWKKGNANITDYNWMVGEMCYVKVFLKNVFDFEILVDMIQLVTEGVRTMTYPTSIIMKRTKKLQELTLKFKPLEKGTINILGVLSKLSNFVHFHPINPKGVALKNISEETKITGIKKIPIKEKISTLKAYFEDQREEVPLYEGGFFHTRFLIENKSETDLCLRKLMISFAFGDNTTMDREIDIKDREVKKFETLSVIICRAVPEEETGIRDLFEMHDHLIFNAFNVANIDKLFKIYVKLIYYEKEKPNISIEDNVAKEVKMMKSLRVYQARVSDSIAADEIAISGKTFKQISVDNSFYLSLEIVRDDPENNNRDYFVSVYKKGQQKPLVEKLMIGVWSNLSMLVKADRSTLQDENGNKINPKEVFYAKWKDTNSLDNGYLFLNNISTESFEAKAEASKLNIEIETDLAGENESHKVKIGALNKIRARVRLADQEKKKLYVSILLSERDQIEEAIRGGNEKGVLYKGKRNHLVELGGGSEEKNEAVIEVGVILTNKTTDYKVFCFAVDEDSGIVYSYKYKNFIQSL